jgi:hypothetical protein
VERSSDNSPGGSEPVVDQVRALEGEYR